MCIDLLDLMRPRALSHLFYEINDNEKSMMNKCVFTDYIVGSSVARRHSAKKNVPYRYRTEQSLRTVTLVHETDLYYK